MTILNYMSKSMPKNTQKDHNYNQLKRITDHKALEEIFLEVLPAGSAYTTKPKWLRSKNNATEKR